MQLMNCVLFPKGSAMRLDSGSPKIEHIKDVLKIGDGGEIFAGNIGGKIYAALTLAKTAPQYFHL